jgi:hypothetical protein
MHESPASPPPLSQIEDLFGAIEPLLGGADLDEIARRTKALTRKRSIKDARTLLRLALARGPGQLSLRQTAAWAHLTGLAELTDPSLNDRLHQADGFLCEVAQTMLCAKADCSKKRWGKRSIRISDGSCISKPGSRGTDWRLHAVYDLDVGGFSCLELTDAKGAEAIDRGRVEPGEIRLADRGYATAGALRRFRDQTEALGADFVVRMRWNAFRLRSPDGQPFDLCRYLESLPAECEIVETRALVQGAGPPFPIRILVKRKSPETAEAEILRLQRRASRKGQKIDPNSLLAARFIILATSLSAEEFSAQDVFEIYRLRWQIELAFKRLKSLLHIDALPATSERGGRSWIYSCLIFAIAVEQSAREFLDSFP